jgi:hypothetical protein
VTREITIRDFFCHRSGLPEHAGDLLADLGFTREQILHRLRYQRPNSSFHARVDGPVALEPGWAASLPRAGADLRFPQRSPNVRAAEATQPFVRCWRQRIRRRLGEVSSDRDGAGAPADAA